MFGDVLSQDLRRSIAADPRSERLVQVRAAVAETIANRVQYAAGVGVVVEADSGTPADWQLLAAAADGAEVEVGHQAVAQEALLLLDVVERIQAAAETQRCRRQLFEHGSMSSVYVPVFPAALSQSLAMINAAVIAAAAAAAAAARI